MMISEQIEAQLKAEIAEAGRTITDPKALAEWRAAMDVSFSAIAAACDVPTKVVQLKMFAASPDRVLPATGPESYAALSLPLTPENYPGGGPEWERWTPWDLLTARLTEALDGAARMHWIVTLYLERGGRFPDPAGFAAWIEALTLGHSEAEVRGWIIDGLAAERAGSTAP